MQAEKEEEEEEPDVSDVVWASSTPSTLLERSKSMWCRVSAVMAFCPSSRILSGACERVLICSRSACRRIERVREKEQRSSKLGCSFL